MCYENHSKNLAEKFQDSSDSTDTAKISPMSASCSSDQSTLGNISPSPTFNPNDHHGNDLDNISVLKYTVRSCMSKSDLMPLTSTTFNLNSSPRYNYGISNECPILAPTALMQSYAQSLNTASTFSSLPPLLTGTETQTTLNQLSSLSSLPSLSTLSLSASLASSTGHHHGDDYDGCGECDGDLCAVGECCGNECNYSTDSLHCTRRSNERNSGVSYIDGSFTSNNDLCTDSHDNDLQDLEMVVGELEEAIKQMRFEDHCSQAGISKQATINNCNKGSDLMKTKNTSRFVDLQSEKHDEDDYDSVHDSGEEIEQSGQLNEQHDFEKFKRNTISYDLTRELKKENSLLQNNNFRRSLRFSRMITPPSTLAIPCMNDKIKAVSSESDGIIASSSKFDSKTSPKENLERKFLQPLERSPTDKNKRSGLDRLRNSLKRPIAKGQSYPPSPQLPANQNIKLISSTPVSKIVASNTLKGHRLSNNLSNPPKKTGSLVRNSKPIEPEIIRPALVAFNSSAAEHCELYALESQEVSPRKDSTSSTSPNKSSAATSSKPTE